MHLFLFFYLLGDEPLQQNLSWIVLLLEGKRIKEIDLGRYLLLLLQSLGKDVKR